MKNEKIRFVPLGGVTDVTKNMYLYEYYKDDQLTDILIVDCGVGFPKEKALGVDLVIPDIAYLTGRGKDKVNKLDKIRGIVFTHGHEDHISGIGYLYDQLGYPPLFASRLTAIFLKKKLEESGFKAKIETIGYEQEYRFGAFAVRFIRMTHSIPDTTHILIKTPLGNLYHGSDFKLDLTPPYGNPPDFYQITKAGKEGILALLSDCLGVEREGLTLSESAIGQTFEAEMRTCRGKLIMTTFSSNISRIRQCIEAAIKFNRKIAFLGRSMKENTSSAVEAGYLPLPQQLLIKEEEVNRYPPNRICLIVAGSQGQFDSALAKLSRDDNRNIKIKPGDKIILSSDPIPGNETEVNDLIEDFIKKGADVIYPSVTDQLHASGHGNEEDIKFLIRFTNPRFFIPIGATVRHQRQYQKLVKKMGYDEKNVFLLDEGQTIWFIDRRQAIIGEKIDTKTIYVDAYGIGDVGNFVLRDRQSLATEGIVVALMVLDQSFHLISPPRIITKGFTFEKGEKDLFNQAKKIIETILKPKKDKNLNLGVIKKEVIARLEEYFQMKKGRKPLIVVEIITL
jgi:ribonuclease J